MFIRAAQNFWGLISQTLNLRLAPNMKLRQLCQVSGPSRQWCCVTELKVPSSGTSSNFDGTGTELVPFQKWWNLS